MHPHLQSYMPQFALARLAQYCAQCRMPWFKNGLITYFLKHYPVKMEEALESNPYAYANFNDFFTRALKPEMRPMVTDVQAIASPVDGQLTQWGTLKKDQLIQAKQHHFPLHALLGETPQSPRVTSYHDGEFMTLYLAPADYHRVHIPIEGQLCHMTHVPGSLFSVNLRTADSISGLFTQNERVILYFNTNIGEIAVILVGAMIVGGIETPWAGTITPPHQRPNATHWEYPQGPLFKRGTEIGRFKLGSTVILLFPKQGAHWSATLTPQTTVRMGALLGYL
jgi:phosphatidylserine decarboxylase